MLDTKSLDKTSEGTLNLTLYFFTFREKTELTVKEYILILPPLKEKT